MPEPGPVLYTHDEFQRAYERHHLMATRNTALTEYMRHGIYYVEPRRCVLWGGRPSRDLQIGSPEYEVYSVDLDCYAEAMRPRAVRIRGSSG